MFQDFQIKSSENQRIGELSVKEGCFSASPHCFLYSCLQILLFHFYSTHPNGQQGANTELRSLKRNKIGTHEFLRNYFFKYLSNINPNEANSFQSKLDQLKAIRVKADYNMYIISEREAKLADQYGQIIKLIITNYLP